MNVEVAYALLSEQEIIVVSADEGLTIEEAIVASKIQQRFPEIDLGVNKVGIFGHAQKLDKVLNEGDRVEIYRPITCDPKEVRRERAALAKKNKERAKS